MSSRVDPFGDQGSRPATPQERGRGYNLTESYIGQDNGSAPAYNGYGAPPNTTYSGSATGDPRAPFGQQQMRASSPYSVESNSTEAWRQRQMPGGPDQGIRRDKTRKIKLQKGAVLSVDHPVPSAIQNAIQPQYRNDLENGSEEFTHMRCMCGLVLC